MASSSRGDITKPKTRAKTNIWLIGPVNETIEQRTKLPTLRETLSVFFYYHKDQKENLKDSARLTVTEVIEFWQRAGIPTSRSYYVEKRLLKVHNEWQTLKKAINRRTEKQVANEEDFNEKLSKIFDIAHENAEELTPLAEDRDFLNEQREGRTSYMTGLDKSWAEKQERQAKKKESLQRYHQKAQLEQEALTASTSSMAAVETSGNSTNDESQDSEVDLDLEHRKRKRSTKSTKRKSLLSEDVAAALDRSKVTDRQAVHLLAATAHSLGHDVNDITISRSSVQRARSANRVKTAETIKASFSPQGPLTVHWDGKLLPDLTGQEKVDRLPVIVTGVDIDQLLGVPKLKSGTGQAQADAVVACLEDWNVSTNVKGLCFDTTASNTGRINGACILIEWALGRSLLHFACRHHVLEIILEKVFTALHISPSSGPDIAIFKRFKDKWSSIDAESFTTASEMPEVATFKDKILQFAKEQLKQKQQRDDYKEFLELAIIFLGGSPARGVHIRAPGALHRARWMSRVLYCFKMWLFRNQFKLRASEERGILQFLLFVTKVYMQAWFTAPSAAEAPSNDLQFMQALYAYSNPTVKEAALTAFKRHLWYLSEVMMGLAFFDDNVDAHEKMLMVRNMREKEGSDEPPHRLDAHGNYEQKTLSSFVTMNTNAFFTILSLPESFLQTQPETWKENEEFKRAEKIVHSLKVVNDTAERGVKLIQDFNAILTKSEEQKQFLLQVVKHHRESYPDSSKTTVVKGLASSPSELAN